jgi:uncharacterized protein DUF222
MCTTNSIRPASAADAVAAIRAGLDYLTTSAAELTGAEQASCLKALAGAESGQLAPTAALLTAFDRSGAYTDDGQATVRSWLRWQTRITSAAAGNATRWARRLRAHPRVAAALADGSVSVSYAQQICDWTDALPEDNRPAPTRSWLMPRPAALTSPTWAHWPRTSLAAPPAPTSTTSSGSSAGGCGLPRTGAATPAWTASSPLRPPPPSARSWTPSAAKPGQKTTAPPASATTTPSRKPAGAWSPAACPTGPGSPPRSCSP